MELTEIDPRGVEPPSDAPKCGYIEQDLVLHGEVPETDLSPAVKFSYHPLSQTEFSEYLNKHEAARGKSVKERERVVLQWLIIPHLKSWDLKKRDGSLVNFADIKELGRVTPAILDYIGSRITETSRDLGGLLGK